jgi:DNA-binding transcriptional LysR family regulator
MELRHLRYFKAVAEHLSFSRAAKHLHLSQSALSRQVKELEGELGIRLFMRDSKQVQLTAPGRVFAKEANSIIDRVAFAIKTVSAYGSRNGSFCIGQDSAIVSPDIFGALARYGSIYSNVELSIREETSSHLFGELHAGTIDIAIIAGNCNSVPPELSYRCVSKEPLSIVLGATHALASRSSIGLREMSSEKLVLYPESQAPLWNDSILSVCKLAGLLPRGFLRANSYGAMLGLIAAGKGYGIMPKVKSAYFHESVLSISISHPRAFVDTCAVWKKTFNSPYIAPFVKELAIRGASLNPPSDSKEQLPLA